MKKKNQASNSLARSVIWHLTIPTKVPKQSKAEQRKDDKKKKDEAREKNAISQGQAVTLLTQRVVGSHSASRSRRL